MAMCNDGGGTVNGRWGLGTFSGAHGAQRHLQGSKRQNESADVKGRRGCTRRDWQCHSQRVPIRDTRRGTLEQAHFRSNRRRETTPIRAHLPSTILEDSCLPRALADTRTTARP